MDSEDSFVNWGFNPNKKSSGSAKYALLWGGANPDDGDSFTGIMQSDDLKLLLKKLWGIWEDYNSYKVEEPDEYIQEEGDRLHFSDEQGLKDAPFLSKYYSNYHPLKVWRKSYGVVNEEKTEKEERLCEELIYIYNLMETLPYEEGRWGDLDDEPDWGRYIEDSEFAFKRNIDALKLKDYEKRLDIIMANPLIAKPRGWHRNAILLEFNYVSDYSCSTWRIVRLGSPIES